MQTSVSSLGKCLMKFPLLILLCMKSKIKKKTFQETRQLQLRNCANHISNSLHSPSPFQQLTDLLKLPFFNSERKTVGKDSLKVLSGLNNSCHIHCNYLLPHSPLPLFSSTLSFMLPSINSALHLHVIFIIWDVTWEAIEWWALQTYWKRKTKNPFLKWILVSRIWILSGIRWNWNMNHQQNTEKPVTI